MEPVVSSAADDNSDVVKTRIVSPVYIVGKRFQ
jgi:hypothetical protein